MSIRYIAVVARNFYEGIEYVESRVSKEQITEIRYQSGYVRLKDGIIYQIITTPGQASQYEFIEMIVDPRYKSLVDEVETRVRR